MNYLVKSADNPAFMFFYGPRGNALHVGRTRDLFERIRQHSRPSKKDAPFWWLLAREETGHRTNLSNGKRARGIAKESGFRRRVSKGKE